MIFSDVAWEIRMLKLATTPWLSVRLQDARLGHPVVAGDTPSLTTADGS